MATPVFAGATEKVSVTFYSWSEQGEQTAEVPDALEVRIYDTRTSPDTLVTTDVAQTGDVTGNFYYLWTPTTDGDFNVQFYAHFSDSSTAISNNYFTVYDETIPLTVALSETYVLSFGAEFTPLLLDPDEITTIYPEASPIEIATYIHNYSLEVEAVYKKTVDLPFIAYEYIRAATACALSRIYGTPFGSFGADGVDSFTLGDLTVSLGAGGANGGNQGNQTAIGSWCELAVALRGEMLRTRTSFKAVTKGSKFRNPIPHRALRRNDYEFRDRNANGIARGREF